MNARVRYTYSVLRYVHDIATGEFVNVAVALHAPDVHVAALQARKTFGRIKQVFPDFQPERFKTSMTHLEQAFSQFNAALDDARQNSKAEARTVLDLAQRVLPPDDGCLQWGPVSTGVSKDPAATLEHLFERYVMRYDTQHQTRQRDADVWRKFSLALEQRQVLRYFTPKTISVSDDALAFNHAWKNGVWHCLAPVSFDLASADRIKEKAHKWLGQVTSVEQSAEDFKVYYLVGKPTDATLEPAFDAALKVLRKSPKAVEIYTESEAVELSERLMQAVGHQRDQETVLAS